MLYKESVIHAYNLNDREIKMAQAGYRFFTNRRNFKRYQTQVKRVKGLIKKTVEDYRDIKLKNLSDAEIKRRFFEMAKNLHLYADTYTKTEPFNLSKIEANESKYRSLIKELGRSRFVLRKQGESLFRISMGILLYEIARRSNLRMSDLFFYTYDEMIKLLNGQKVKKDVIAKRRKGYALISLKDRKILLTGEKFKKIYKEVYKEVINKGKKAKEIMGQVAMKGKAKGKVRIILHNKRDISKELAKFKKGEILVTEMTRPDTVLVCRKAAAIITDEGSITSHAAIISRELKIPCVIGTKTATQVLKDGDLVKVDAVKGMVEIIKRGK